MNIFKSALVLLISTVIIGSSYGVVLANGTEAPDPEGLYNEKCSICHTIERSSSRKKSRLGWERTVIRMMQNGAPITEKEVYIIIDYLEINNGK